MMRESTLKSAHQDVLDSNLVGGFDSAREETMTVAGSVNKTLVLGALLVGGAFIGFMYPMGLFLWPAAIAGFVLVLISAFKPSTSPYIAPLYSGIEGLFVGAITAIYAAEFAGIAFQAITITMGMLFLMLFIYKTGLVKVDQKFRAGVYMATGAVMLVYLINIGLSFFGMHMPYLHEGGMIGIGISLVIIGIAAMNLLLDFDNFEKGEAMGLPKYMEWFFAMSLIVTIIWLYLEILRLLAKLNRD
jgi:uncharacterized YccA/Bax inhibitor family protein